MHLHTCTLLAFVVVAASHSAPADYLIVQVAPCLCLDLRHSKDTRHDRQSE